jgi:hypothetical protein
MINHHAPTRTCSGFGRGASGRLLRNAAAAFTVPDLPRGSLVAPGATNCNVEADDVAAKLAARRVRTEAAIRARVERGLADGDLLPGLAALARAHLVAVLCGMDVKTRDGASPALLGAASATSWRCGG